MKNSYVSYNEVYSSTDTSGADDAGALIAAADDKKRKQAAGKTQKPARTQKSSLKKAPLKKAAGKGTTGKGTTGKKTAAKKKAVKKSPAKKSLAGTPLASAHSGFFTKGVHAGLRGFEALNGGAQGMSFSAWMGCAALVLLTALTATAWLHSPTVPPMAYHIDTFHIVEREHSLPMSLWKKYIMEYPQRKIWYKHRSDGTRYLRQPSIAEFQDFVSYLEGRQCIAHVHGISMGYAATRAARTGTSAESAVSQPRRVILCDLELRVPAMKIILANGQAAWVDSEGVQLPGILPAPKEYESRPALYHVNGNDQALQEVLAFWPLLEQQIDSELIVSIDLNGILQKSVAGKILQRGIVLKTKQGTPILWGRAGDERYGMYAAEKIEKLMRTLRNQGSLESVKEIDVRHTQPTYTLVQSQR